VLPDTQVIEFATRVVIRAEARRRAEVAAKDEIEAEKIRRNELRREREGFASILVPLVVVGCIIWIGFLAFGNVSVRRFEIGILMAIGLRARQVFSVFLAKAALMGLVGGLVGYFVGFGVGSFWGETPGQLFDPGLLVLVIVAAPLLACLAGLIPAMLAAGQDPAVVLTEE
jgi:ABC-type lipoprotein release transport system permease subunit